MATPITYTSRIPDGTFVRENDFVIFSFNGTDYHYIVNSNHLSLNRRLHKDGANSIIFKMLALDSYVFVNNAYGYKNRTGDWPCCNNLDFEALTRCINALFAEIVSRQDPKLAAKAKRDAAKLKRESDKAAAKAKIEEDKRKAKEEAERLEQERLDKILPDYKVEPVIIIEAVDISALSYARKTLVAKDLAAKGYLVSISHEALMKGTGLVGTALFDSIANYSRLFKDNDDYLITRGHDKFFVRKLSTEDLAKYNKIIPNVIGKAGEYDIVLQDDRLVIGCQRIPKENAVKIAQGILDAFKVKA